MPLLPRSRPSAPPRQKKICVRLRSCKSFLPFSAVQKPGGMSLSQRMTVQRSAGFSRCRNRNRRRNRHRHSNSICDLQADCAQRPVEIDSDSDPDSDPDGLLQVQSEHRLNCDRIRNGSHAALHCLNRSPILSTCSCNLKAKAIRFPAHLLTTHAQEPSYARLH